MSTGAATVVSPETPTTQPPTPNTTQANQAEATQTSTSSVKITESVSAAPYSDPRMILDLIRQAGKLNREELAAIADANLASNLASINSLGAARFDLMLDPRREIAELVEDAVQGNDALAAAAAAEPADESSETDEADTEDAEAVAAAEGATRSRNPFPRAEIPT